MLSHTGKLGLGDFGLLCWVFVLVAEVVVEKQLEVRDKSGCGDRGE